MEIKSHRKFRNQSPCNVYHQSMSVFSILGEIEGQCGRTLQKNIQNDKNVVRSEFLGLPLLWGTPGVAVGSVRVGVDQATHPRAGELSP